MVLLLLGTPIAVALGLSAMASWTVLGTDVAQMMQIAYTSVDSFPIMARPAFVLACALMENAGISRRLAKLAEILACNYIIARKRGFTGLQDHWNVDEIFQTIKNGIWSIIAPIVILGGVYTGMFMETLATIMLVTPVLLPVMMQFGVDPIHFGLVLVVCCEIGFQTPPLGGNLFMGSNIAGISI